MNLRTRLALTFIIAVSPVLLLFLAYFYYYFYRSMQEDFSDTLRNRGITMTHLLLEKKAFSGSLLRRIDEDTYTTYSNRRVAIYDVHDKLLYDSGELNNLHKGKAGLIITPALLAQIARQKEVQIADGPRSGIGLLLHQPNGYYHKVVSYAIDDYGRNKLRGAILVSAASFLVAFLVVIVLSQLFAGRSIKPIADMIQQIERISVSNMEARLVSRNNGDELARLAATFNEMLDRISNFEMQRSFVSNASHELRTPLTLITNQIEVALIKPRTDAEYREMLRSILEDIDKLNALSNGLLELAQFDVKHMQVTWSTLDLDEVLYEAVATILHKHPDYNVTFMTDLQDEDASLPSVQIRAEASLLTMAFINLIENGCKFSPDHQARIRLVISPATVEATIEDRGIGIAVSELDYIFQPFYRATNAKVIKGNGIGLSLTEKIIKLHGGSIAVRSQLNVGTTFVISLPRDPQGKE
ncbi:sensor histidine kinase [Spirosoma arcticum]